MLAVLFTALLILLALLFAVLLTLFSVLLLTLLVFAALRSFALLAPLLRGGLLPLLCRLVVFATLLPLLGGSNATKTYGAIVAITETDMLDSKFPKGYYLIPSSVHEMLVMPADIGISIDDMNEMVRGVNEAEVKPEEVLSDHVYDFTR